MLERAAETVLALVAVGDGEVAAARRLGAKVWELPAVQRGTVAITTIALCAHTDGDLTRSQQLADEAVATLSGSTPAAVRKRPGCSAQTASRASSSKVAGTPRQHCLSAAIDRAWRRRAVASGRPPDARV